MGGGKLRSPRARGIRLAATPGNNLPANLGTFIGRGDETRALIEHLAQTRLLTLIGAGGCGKTRQALEVALAAADHFPDGVWFVDLAGLADPELVPHEVAAVLGVRERPGKTVAAALREALRDRKLLLVVDNCEHLIDSCAHLADSLLSACRRVRILATSRERLNIAGEVTWRVPSLQVPDSEQGL